MSDRTGEFMNDFLKNMLLKIGIEADDKQIFQLNKYYEMLVERNKVVNLTAITEYNDVVIKHFIDSLMITKIYDLESAEKIIDIGTGAGFPGMIYKIMFPNSEITLLDSLNKRIKFLDDVIEELGLKGIITLHGRAEDYAKDKKHREQYNLVVSRAVANLATLSEYCMPYVRLSGKFISYKASDCDDEVQNAKKAVNLLGGKIHVVETVEIPDTDIERKFIVIEKIKNTSAKYPRKAGLPSKEPLI